MSCPERIVRVSITAALVAAVIVFWSLPIALVGSLSNIIYLTDKVRFLDFLLKTPPAILGFVSGVLPSATLAILMALIPTILRCTGFSHLADLE
jgi:hypothetical protein